MSRLSRREEIDCSDDENPLFSMFDLSDNAQKSEDKHEVMEFKQISKEFFSFFKLPGESPTSHRIFESKEGIEYRKYWTDENTEDDMEEESLISSNDSDGSSCRYENSSSSGINSSALPEDSSGDMNSSIDDSSGHDDKVTTRSGDDSRNGAFRNFGLQALDFLPIHFHSKQPTLLEGVEQIAGKRSDDDSFIGLEIEFRQECSGDEDFVEIIRNMSDDEDSFDDDSYDDITIESAKDIGNIPLSDDIESTNEIGKMPLSADAYTPFDDLFKDVAWAVDMDNNHCQSRKDLMNVQDGEESTYKRKQTLEKRYTKVFDNNMRCLEGNKSRNKEINSHRKEMIKSKTEDKEPNSNKKKSQEHFESAIIPPKSNTFDRKSSVSSIKALSSFRKSISNVKSLLNKKKRVQ